MNGLNCLCSAAIIGGALLVASAGFAGADDPMSEYERHTFTSHGGTLPYRLLKPAGDPKSGKYPLILALHGWGQRGADNHKQLKFFGPTLLKKSVREKFPCFVLLPQANGSWIQHAVFDKPIPLTKTPAASLAMALDLVTRVTKKYPIDTDRIYLMGISNGACGVWELLERNPRPWAAAVVLAGAGDPSKMAPVSRMPIWAFHAADDSVIPIARMKELIAALRAAHGHPRQTVIPHGDHGAAWNQGLKDRDLVPWLFAQRRGVPARPPEMHAGESSR